MRKKNTQKMLESRSNDAQGNWKTYKSCKSAKSSKTCRTVETVKTM